MTPSRTSILRRLAQHWCRRLAHYSQHGNDEHLEALLHEAAHFIGLHLESALQGSAYWSTAPLARRAAVMLLLVDRAIVVRRPERGRFTYEAVAGAEDIVAAQPGLAPYMLPTLELIAALRQHRARSQGGVSR